MSAIELSHIEAAFLYATKIFDGKISSERAAARLRDDHDPASIQHEDFIAVVPHP